MPNRIVRESLLHSDRWLNLRDNTARVCYIALLLTADDVGNLEGSPVRLRRLWRDYGIDSDLKVAKILAEFVDADLARIYQSENKEFLHIPRFRQVLRHVKVRSPGSPWDDADKIQRVADKTRSERYASDMRSLPESNRIESLNRIEDQTPVDNSKTGTPKPPPGWWKTNEGIVQAAAIMNVATGGKTYYQLKQEVFKRIAEPTA